MWLMNITQNTDGTCTLKWSDETNVTTVVGTYHNVRHIADLLIDDDYKSRTEKCERKE